MWAKRLLRFYRSAEKLNDLFDGIMEHVAVQSCFDEWSLGVRYAERLIALTEDKRVLADLYARLNGVMEGLTEADRVALFKYADRGARTASEEDEREQHRALVKFTRRAHCILKGGGEGVRLVKKYYCLMFPDFGGDPFGG